MPGFKEYFYCLIYAALVALEYRVRDLGGKNEDVLFMFHENKFADEKVDIGIQAGSIAVSTRP